MRLHAPGPYKPKRSSHWWFRIVVPERPHAAADKREIKETPGTVDINVALVKYAAKMAEVRPIFARLEQQQASAFEDRADKIVAMDAMCRGGNISAPGWISGPTT